MAWASGAEEYLRDCIGIFEEYGWDWTYHAFREWPGWSVEHEGTCHADLHPSADNPRMRALLKGLRGVATGEPQTIGAEDAVFSRRLPNDASLVLENDAIRAEIVPAWAGRLMFFGRADGPNVLWTQPEAARFTIDAGGKPVWRNVGGEKTWVGSQGRGWRAFAGKESGSVWPPPAWFDSEQTLSLRIGPRPF